VQGYINQPQMQVVSLFPLTFFNGLVLFCLRGTAEIFQGLKKKRFPAPDLIGVVQPIKSVMCHRNNLKKK